MFQVLLNGVDISADVVPAIKVSRRVKAAGLATFKYRVSGAPVLPADLIRQPVVINWNSQRLYTGDVNTADWDMASRTFTIQASNFLQEKFEGKTNTEIETILPGALYSDNVFGERRNGWQYAQDLLDTLTQDVFVDRNGNLQTATWDSTPVEDHAFNESNIVNGGAYTLDLTKGRDTVTQMKSTYKYRISRWKRRKHSFNYSAYTYFCDYLTDGGASDTYSGYQVPTRDSIIAAANGSGWTVGKDGLVIVLDEKDGIYFDTWPLSGWYCTADRGPIGWLITDELRSMMATGARWSAFRKWAQTITEVYEITFDAVGAQPTYGIVVKEENANYQPEVDDSSFENAESIELEGVWTTDAIGDAVQDQDNIATRDNDITVLWQMAYTAFYNGLRSNYVTIQTPILTGLELNHTVDINTNEIEAHGRMYELQHDITLHKQLTTVKIAVSNGGGGISDALVMPDKPDTAPTYPAPSSSTSLGNHIGGCTDSPVEQPDWDGWFTSNTWCELGAEPDLESDKYYDSKFVVIGPDIEDEARDDIEATQTVTYNIAVPQDTLILK